VTLEQRILDRLRHAIEGGALAGLTSVAPADTGVPTSH
jgi:hypothetical protein